VKYILGEVNPKCWWNLDFDIGVIRVSEMLPSCQPRNLIGLLTSNWDDLMWVVKNNIPSSFCYRKCSICISCISFSSGKSTVSFLHLSRNAGSLSCIFLAEISTIAYTVYYGCAWAQYINRWCNIIVWKVLSNYDSHRLLRQTF